MGLIFILICVDLLLHIGDVAFNGISSAKQGQNGVLYHVCCVGWELTLKFHGIYRSFIWGGVHVISLYYLTGFCQ